MYGQYQYGILPFGADPGSENPAESYMPDLMDYLPKYWHGIREMKEIQDDDAKELGSLQYAKDTLLEQYFINTATWGLDIWERELGLSTDYSKPLEWRREIVLAKLRGAGTTTKAMIKSAASAFSGGEVDVIEHPAENRFEVQFIGVRGIPPNMPGLMQLLEEMKPAHLAYSFKYTYTTWDMLKSMVWQQTGSRTWNELKTYGGA